jgi:hypothetical protein
MDVCLGVERFGAFDVAERTLQREILGRVPGNPAAVRIETRPIEIVTVFVRFAPGEYAAFHFDPAKAGPNHTGRGHAERDVR